MSDPDADTMVDNYFRRLDEVLASVPLGHREQLLDELRDHVSQARVALDVESPAAIREILERIGTPEEIATEELGEQKRTAGLVGYLHRGRAMLTRAPSMSEQRWVGLGGFAGLLFVLAFLVATLIAPTVPNVDADVDVVTNYFNLYVHPLIASGLIGTSAAFLFLWFLGTIHRLVGRAGGEVGVPASVLLASGTVFAAVAALGSIFTTTLAILAGQSPGNLSSAPYVPAAFVLRTIVGTGIFGLAGGLFVGVLGIAMVTAKLVGGWFGLLCLVLGACNVAGGGAALVLGSYNETWTVIQSIGVFGIAFVVLAASAVMILRQLPVREKVLAAGEDREVGGLFGRLRGGVSPRLVLVGLFAVVTVAAAVVVPLSTRSSDADLSAATVLSPGDSAISTPSPGTANVADANSTCAPTTDAATSGGPAGSLSRTASQVASGTVEGRAWSLWSATGQTGATGLEDGGFVFDGRAYGLCPGYPNPAELEMIDTSAGAVVYGVIGYPGKASVDLSVGTVGSFATGRALPSPEVQVVNGVSFFVGTLPESACVYGALELNSTSPGVSAEHNLGFGGSGESQVGSISGNPGNGGGCVVGQIDPINFSQGIWQLPPGQFTDSFR